MDRFGEVVGSAVDLDALIGIARSASQMPEPGLTPPRAEKMDLRIGIAMDTAFGFYYGDDLEAFRRAGAELVPLDLIEDDSLPELDGLFIGGGFPEARMQGLAANAGIRQQIRQAVEAGLPTYAECGGLMYLCNSIEWQGEKADMAGVIDAEVLMHRRPQGRGHIVLQTNGHPWLPSGSVIKAHEFHYASLENIPSDSAFAAEVQRGFGIDGAHDMIVKHNLVAGFCHMRQTGALDWVDRFVTFVRANKKPREN
jgi:cobyrinic acid a,c-diamide synthase